MTLFALTVLFSTSVLARGLPLTQPRPCLSQRLKWSDRTHRHAKYVKKSTDESRYYIIGDVHGCYDEFVTMLHEISNIDKRALASGRIIVAGDLVNKGPKSIDVIRHCRKHDILSAKGNHEEAVYQIMAGGKEGN